MSNDNSPTTRVYNIQCTIRDLVSDLLFYDRREDEELPLGEIQDAIREGEITPEALVKTFRDELYSRLDP